MSTLKILNDENNIAEIYFSGNNISQEHAVDFLLPSSDDKFHNFNDVNKDKLIAAAPKPKDQAGDYFMKYSNKGKLSWSEIRSSLGAYEANARFVGPVIDYPTGIQTYNITDKSNIEEHYTELASNYKKPEWVSLHACVSDIGLRQLTWNTNEEYYNYNYTSEKKPLLFKYQNEIDQHFVYEIKFVDSEYEKIQTGYFHPDSNNFNISKNLYSTINLDEEEGEDKNKISHKLTTDTKAHVVSLKILKSKASAGSYMPINTGPIELYYEIDTDGSTTNSGNGGIAKLDLYKIENDTDNCFNYNCQYQNCQYQNCQYINCKFINNIYDRNIDFFTSSRTTNNPDVEGIHYDGPKDFSSVFDFIKEQFEKEYGSFDSFLTEFRVDETIELELEGGYGRKATLLINYETEGKETIKINNKGYLYKENDKLRFKDFRLRDLVYFNITDLEDENKNADDETSHYIQEFISPGAGKSNTIKYTLGKNESFVIKKLNITGSIGSNVIVRLNHIKNIFSENPIQNILKEFYYFSRDNINESHDIDILIDSDSNSIGNEFFIDIQKIVKTNDDKDKKNTLSFSLSGIKFTKV
jgi:hypothetical protein